MLVEKYSNQAKKFLKNCDKILIERILNKIESLKSDPFPKDVKRIESKNLFRIRLGKIRILYEVDHQNSLLGIVKIDKRERAYN